MKIARNEVTAETFEDAIEPSVKLEGGEAVEVKLADPDLDRKPTRSRRWLNLMSFLVYGKRVSLPVNKELFDYFNEVGKVGLVDIINDPNSRFNTFVNLRTA